MSFAEDLRDSIRATLADLYEQKAENDEAIAMLLEANERIQEDIEMHEQNLESLEDIEDSSEYVDIYDLDDIDGDV